MSYRVFCIVSLLLLVAPIAPVIAQEAEEEEVEREGTAAEEEVDPELKFFGTINVTSTSRERATFEVAPPVIVVDEAEIIEEMPNSAADLLREKPGVDVNGVGPNQARPIIRGQRGLRVLFMENGLRMNNARRQTDFGEITGLVDVDNVSAVEVQRGPASVLYGTDAIGGVINLITHLPGQAPFTADLGLRYSDADEQTKVSAGFGGRGDRFSYKVNATFRDTSDYESGEGIFGQINLPSGVIVNDTAIEDDSLYTYLDWDLSDRSTLFTRWTRYRADRTGFGFVDPELLEAEPEFLIQILYPYQDFDRWTLGYIASGLTTKLASTIELQAYYQNNERELVNDIFIDIGPIFGGIFGEPNSSVEADTLNFTDLETFGARGEVGKALGSKNFLTYGFDYWEDDSFNTDSSVTTTTLRSPFPLFPACTFNPMTFFFDCVTVSTDTVPNAPNATNESVGLFVQDELFATDRLSMTVGARWGRVDTAAEPTVGFETAGLDFSDDVVVGAFSIVYGVTDNFNLVGSWGTGFRAPNIIERLFNGITPEGAGFQVLNTDLVSEESENYDIGFKYLGRRGFFDATYFENEITDAIVQYTLSMAEIMMLPQEIQDEIEAAGGAENLFVVQQRNADELTFEGVEVAGGYRWDNGFSLGGNYTHLTGESQFGGPAENPTGETFSDKYNGFLRYDDGRWWVAYHVRHNEDQDVVLDPGAEVSPIGPVLPAFTIHSLSGGATLYEAGAWSHYVGVVVDNLTDELYAEFSNASFFRPEPGRNIMVTYRLRRR